ncbi:MAG: EI24 domain-containing protein [Pseudomonadota bacterium]
MRAVLQAYGRALISQLSARMLLLSFIPFFLSVLLWGVLLWLGLQPLVDGVHNLFSEHGGFSISNGVLAAFGLGLLKTVIVPLIAMLLLLPLMILTSLIFMGVAAMPAIVRHVGRRSYPQLEKKSGGGWFGSLLAALGAFGLFLLAWLVVLPLYFVPPLALLAQVLLWGWLTSRVMAYDALADYASADERRQLLRAHRWPLLAIGVASGAAGAIPGLLWLGGALSVVLFPFLAVISIWLYVLIFVFTGLWFQHYCMAALANQRAAAIALPTVAPG